VGKWFRLYGVKQFNNIENGVQTAFKFLARHFYIIWGTGQTGKTLEKSESKGHSDKASEKCRERVGMRGTFGQSKQKIA
jgi:hypothetical protein